MTVTVENISRSNALELLKNVQGSVAEGLALRGKFGYECINTDTVSASIYPNENTGDGGDLEKPDFEDYTFKIYSNYWAKHTLKEYAGLC